MPDLNMRAADPCPTNNAKRSKHSKILKPGCFFVFTPFYQWTNSVLCEEEEEVNMSLGQGFIGTTQESDRDI
jgi:hypothetical protein